MNKFIDSFLNIFLIILICLLVLNQFYVVEFSDNLKNVFIFLTLIIILLTSVKELLTTKSGFTKFSSIVILISTITGGIFAVINKQLNIFIYICLFFSLLQCFMELINVNVK